LSGQELFNPARMFALLNYSHTSSFANTPFESKWHAYQPQTNVWANYATGGNQFHPEACDSSSGKWACNAPGAGAKSFGTTPPDEQP
jgi:hypothetical protein